MGEPSRCHSRVSDELRINVLFHLCAYQSDWVGLRLTTGPEGRIVSPTEYIYGSAQPHEVISECSHWYDSYGDRDHYEDYCERVCVKHYSVTSTHHLLPLRVYSRLLILSNFCTLSCLQFDHCEGDFHRSSGVWNW